MWLFIVTHLFLYLSIMFKNIKKIFWKGYDSLNKNQQFEQANSLYKHWIKLNNICKENRKINDLFQKIDFDLELISKIKVWYLYWDLKPTNNGKVEVVDQWILIRNICWLINYLSKNWNKKQ